MPALQVRDLPQDIYDDLVRSAKRDHRSIAQQTTHILAEHFRVIEGGKGKEEPQIGSTSSNPEQWPKNPAEFGTWRFDLLAKQLELDPSTFVPMTDEELEEARGEYLMEKFGV